MAALIKQDRGLDAELVPGNRGEFTVWVDDRKVAEKSRSGFPSDGDLIRAVRAALSLE